MRTTTRNTGREPDLLFVANENLHRLRNLFLDGRADVAVELISNESSRRDMITKFDEYEAGGVREYWLIHPDNRTFTMHVLGDDGKFNPMPAKPVMISQAIDGFPLHVAWLWQIAAPTVSEIYKAWKVS